jgi:hypothetical protein
MRKCKIALKKCSTKSMALLKKLKVPQQFKIIAHNIWNLKVHYHIHNSPPLAPIPMQIIQPTPFTPPPIHPHSFFRYILVYRPFLGLANNCFLQVTYTNLQ